jgi:hypothetical protein
MAMIIDVRLRFLFCIIPLISLAGHQTPVLAAHYEGPAAVLNGIKEIYVSVKPIENPSVIEAGMDEGQIKAMVERQLRKAGISLLSREEYDRYKMTLRYPLANLEIRVTFHELEGMETAVIDLNVRLIQVVFLARKAIVQFNGLGKECKYFYSGLLCRQLPLGTQS